MLVSLFLVCLGSSPAHAAIQIYDSSEAATYLGEIKKGECKVKRVGKGRTFNANGKTTNGVYKLHIHILDFTGFKRVYDIPYGGMNPSVNLEGVSSSADYSNNYGLPGGQAPPSAGAIRFAKDGAKLAIGVYALPNADASAGVSLVGALKCPTPAKRPARR